MNISNDWDESRYKYIHLAPSADVSEEYRAWQGCPTVAVTRGGRIFAGWYTGGAFEPCIHNYNVLVKSDDGGESFSSPVLTVHSDYENRHRNIDIQLWVNSENHLWVMWTHSPYYETSRPGSVKDFVVGRLWDYHREFTCTELMVCKNPDGENLVWEKPRIMCEGFMRNKPIELASGRIIAPAYDYSGEYKLRISDDGGESFYNLTVSGKPDPDVYDEIAICERCSGELRFLARTNRGYYVYSDSADGGDSWTRADEYESAPSTRCYYGRLKGGMIAYVRNVSDTERRGMKICLSADGGDSFPYELILDERETLSYPDIDEDYDGNIYILYDRERDNRLKLNTESWISEAAKEIILCKVKVEDIIGGTLSPSSFMRRVISKAKINVVTL